MALSSTLSSLGGGALSFFILIFAGLLTAGLVGLIMYGVMKWRRYNQYDCVIWERDGFGQLREKKDKAGIFVDVKTKNKRLFLKENKVGLSPDNIPYIPKGNRKVIYLLQSGLKNFTFIKPTFNSPLTFSVGEEDVNWAVNAYERQKVRFMSNMLLQYLPYISLAFVSIIILFMVIYVVKEFSVLKDVANALNEASRALAQANSGTTVIPS